VCFFLSGFCRLSVVFGVVMCVCGFLWVLYCVGVGMCGFCNVWV
jgi:hypothetical protein